MCGIFALIESNEKAIQARIKAIELSRKQQHRGPDDSGCYVIENNGKTTVLCHERLDIVDTTSGGHQPMVSPNNENIVFVYNGEIYNYQEIKKRYEEKFEFKGTSDSEVLGPLYNDYGIDLVHHIEGMWAFFVYDKKTNVFYAARDHVGIIPCYIGVGKNGERYISSELKAISSECESVDILLPGHYLTNDWVQRPWYMPKWQNMDAVPANAVDFDEFRGQLTEAVRSHLTCDVPFGLLLSGGVDSSIIASIAMRLVKQHQVDIKRLGMKEVHSFCIGLEDSPDLEKSRQVAKAIGTTHHEFVFTVQEGLDALPQVVHHLETFNPTTLRAGTPMYLMARKIKALGIKMVLTGEGADEILGGYLYFHKAPNAVEFHKETVRKVNDLYKYDLLRANKSGLAFGLEVRPPFLHKPFLEYSMAINPEAKMPSNCPRNIEKYILRKSFDDPKDPYLPDEVLWRQKEQFSDGVGYKWLESIRSYANELVSDEEYKKRESIYPIATPTSKEMFMHRRTFEKRFPGESNVRTVPFARSIACSTEAALEWDEAFKRNTDESGRSVLGVHCSEQLMKEEEVADTKQ